MKKKETVRSDPAQRLHALFRSNQRSTGRYDPATGRMHTEYKHMEPEDWATHLSGATGYGAVPIMDDGTAVWGAIDIDNHDSGEDIPMVPVDERVKTNRLPLILCRSKSGGIHAYVFLAKAQPASRVRSMLGRWAEMIGYASAEIFPKQNRLARNSATGQLQLGNWINLPYLGGDATTRYCFRNGRKLTLAEFLNAAEHARLTQDDIDAQVFSDHAQAPPCIQAMMIKGVEAGMRNEAMYNTVVYLRRAFPESFEERSHEMNASMFTKPLNRVELSRTVNSAARPEYSYRCGEEPIRSLCDREKCIMRKFGINKAELDNLRATQEIPPLTDLVKYESEPVRWELRVDGIRVANISTGQLMEWRAMRELMTERLVRMIPNLKPQEWDRMLAPLMLSARVIDTPDDASVNGVVRDRLREFASKTDLDSRGEEIEDRKALLRGLPAVQVLDGDRSVCFRAKDFINYLKRTKSEELKGVNLWLAVRDMGVRHTKFRAGEHNINVWHIPVTEIIKGREAAIAAEFKSDL